MKSLNISRVCLVAALAIGAIVLSVGTCPTTAEADAFIGGFYPVSSSDCCYSHHTGWCTEAAEDSDDVTGSANCTKPATLLWCEGDDDGDSTCGPEGATPPCFKPGDPVVCNTTFNGECD
ncbi:MAG: hypothetical protein ACYTBJ_07860 [Planctomycetota bacterium]|jgi:hypothetical protein